MKRIRIAYVYGGLVIAILAGLSVTALNLSLARQKMMNLQAGLKNQTAARVGAENQLAQTRSLLLTATTRWEAARTALETATVEKENALALATSQTKRVEALNQQAANIRKELEETKVELGRYRAAGMEPEQIIEASVLFKGLQKELAAVRKNNNELLSRIKLLDQWADEDRPTPLPAGLKARVIALDPKWQFVVLDAGDEQGILKYAEVLLSHDGKLVGKAKVSRVEKDRCVANLVPGWEIGEVTEGDLAIPALPRS